MVTAYKKQFCEICESKQKYIPLFSHYDNNYFVDKKIYNLIYCKNCGVASIQNKPTQSAMSKYYEENYYSYDTSLSIFFQMKNKWTKVIANIKNNTVANRFLFGGLYMLPKSPRAKVLDVGCGDGSALLTLKKLGFNKLYGTEINLQVCKQLKAKGISAYCASDITTLKMKEVTYDLIRMSHVLEHVYNPRETLAFLHSSLDSGGDLLLGVPNFNSLASRIFGKYFCALQMPTHLYHFNRRNLKNLLKDEGFQVKQIKTTGFSGVSASIITALKDKWGWRNIPRGLSTILIIALIPLEVVLNIIGQGYIINVHAIKI